MVFTNLEQAAPALGGLRASGQASQADEANFTPERWPAWIRTHDHDIRLRLIRGQEDTLTNFLRSGSNFTQAPPIGIRDLLDYDSNAQVRAVAERRIEDLGRALQSHTGDEHVAQMRGLLQSEAVDPESAVSDGKLHAFLLKNMLRMREEYLGYLHQPQGANPFQAFKDRGISLDTNLWPDFLIEVHLRHMADAGLLKPKSVKRVAIVGPGLDFTNKESGNDFYPPQTNQPFAVIDSLLRLGLADEKSLEVYTWDISQEVNLHITRAHERAARGLPYVLQLPWSTSAPLAPEYRTRFEAYWRSLGEKIGQPTPPIPIPAGLASRYETRAVTIRPEIVDRVHPVDIDVVCQQVHPEGNDGFDLVIGTNVFVYYGTLDQLLLRSNISRMLRPGGFLLSNDKLPDTVPQVLENGLVTSQVVGQAPEFMFSYRRPADSPPVSVR